MSGKPTRKIIMVNDEKFMHVGKTFDAALTGVFVNRLVNLYTEPIFAISR